MKRSPKVSLIAAVYKDLEALKLIVKSLEKQTYKNFELVLTTTKKYKETYIKSIGWVKHSQIPELINRSDICVVPSIWEEPFGIAVVEAMACGKAVIASDAGNIPEIIEDGCSGFIFYRNKKNDLEEKLKLLIENKELRIKFGNKARQRAVEKFDWDKIYEEFYCNLFDKSIKD